MSCEAGRGYTYSCQSGTLAILVRGRFKDYLQPVLSQAEPGAFVSSGRLGARPYCSSLGLVSGTFPLETVLT